MSPKTRIHNLKSVISALQSHEHPAAASALSEVSVALRLMTADRDQTRAIDHLRRAVRLILWIPQPRPCRVRLLLKGVLDDLTPNDSHIDWYSVPGGWALYHGVFLVQSEIHGRYFYKYPSVKKTRT